MRPLFRWRAASGKRRAASASPARCAVSVSRRGLVGRSVVGSVMFWRWGRVIVWRICSAGVAVSGFVSGLSYHAHARARAARSRRPCDNVYIIARCSPRPGWFSSLFEHFKAREACISSPPVLFPCPFSFPLKTNLHFLTHAPTPLSLKISPSIEFLSFRQSNYALNLK